MDDSPWFRQAFNQDYLDLYGPYLETRTEMELEGLDRLCPPGPRVLDLACGHGRHAVALALRGLDVTGVDLSQRFLDEGRLQARRKGVKVSWRKLDLRRMAYQDEFDTAICMYHSFGYFAEDAQNRLILEATFRALRPGGAFLLDLIGLQAVPELVGFRKADTGRHKLVENVEFDTAGQCLRMHQTISRGRSQREYLHLLRLYRPDQLRGILESVGFQVTGQWGGFDGCPTDQGDRLITVACRPSEAGDPATPGTA